MGGTETQTLRTVAASDLQANPGMDSPAFEPEDPLLRESRASSSSPSRADDVSIRSLSLAANEHGLREVLRMVEHGMGGVR